MVYQASYNVLYTYSLIKSQAESVLTSFVKLKCYSLSNICQLVNQYNTSLKVIKATQQMTTFILSIKMRDYICAVYQLEMDALSLMSVTVCHCVHNYTKV